MTLILTTVHRGGVFQVIDRLLTDDSTGTTKRFDPVANKTVMFAARDALVTLSYTGLAYLDVDLPTDQWISETLRGTPTAAGSAPMRPPAFSSRRVENWLSWGESVRRLASELDATIAGRTPGP